MIYRSRSPLRVGLAGGGTDVSPYSDIYGGAILNATVSLYAYATIEPRSDGKIVMLSVDRAERFECDSCERLEIDGNLSLLKGVYNRVVKDFAGEALSFTLTTYVDAPAGSGLGTSSTLTVAILGAFSEWLQAPLGEYDTAQLAYLIERKDLAMAGGKQDQYAATFGGFNFMEFYADDKVIVNPLRIKPDYVNELEFDILLYYTGTSRLSSKIIDAQTKKVVEKDSKSIEATHKVKEQATMMKEALLRGELEKIGEILDFGWRHKKLMAKEISNPVIDEIYSAALASGATGGKISGAGGGGFMMIFCPLNSRFDVIKRLEKFGGVFKPFRFTKGGLDTWKVNGK